MSEEMDRLRRLADQAPTPSRHWVRETRDDLLDLAAAEHAEDAREFRGLLSGVLSRFRRRGRQRSPALALAAAALVVVAAAATAVVLEVAPAGQPDAPVAQPAAPPSPSVTPSASESGPETQLALGASCSGGDGLYTIGYPAGWHTNSGEVADPCQVFDQRPVELEAGTGGGPMGPIVVQVLPVDLQTATDPGRGNRMISQETVTVDRRTAVRLLWESTGRTVLPEGVRSYRYAIDLGSRTLMAAAYDTDQSDFEQRKRLLDRMVSALQIDDGL